MNKKVLYICVVVVIVLFLGGIMFTYFYFDNKFHEHYNIHYEINITTNSTEKFVLYMPVPIASRIESPIKDQPIRLINELEIINGNTSYSIINTEYGFALNVSGFGNITLVGHWEIDDPTTEEESYYLFGELSMYTDHLIKGPHMIFFNSSSNDTILDFSCYNKRSHSRGGHNYEWGIQQHKLINGWRIVDIYITSVIWD